MAENRIDAANSSAKVNNNFGYAFILTSNQTDFVYLIILDAKIAPRLSFFAVWRLCLSSFIDLCKFQSIVSWSFRADFKFGYQVVLDKALFGLQCDFDSSLTRVDSNI